jgi:hypothetical protein
MTKGLRPALLLASALVLASGPVERLACGDPAAEPRVKVEFASGAPALQQQRWVDAALVPTVPDRIVLDPGPCPTPPGACTAPGTPIWLATYETLNSSLSEREQRAELRHTLMHELGHKFDYHLMTEDARARFVTLTGDRFPWRAEAGGSPSERFAEAYAICAWPDGVQRNALTWVGGYDYEPTFATQETVCELIRSVATGRSG